MANTLSINQIVSILRDLSIRSKIINDFGFGNTFDLNAKENIKYPILWVEPVTNTSIDSGGNGYRSMLYGFNLYVLDRIDKGDGNYQDLLSDTQYNLSTMIAEIEQHIFYIQNNMSLVNDIRFTPVTYEYDDNVNGYMAEINIRVPLRYSPCNNPIQSITGFTVSNTSNITEYRLVGSQGFQGASGMQGFQGNIGFQGMINGDFVMKYIGSSIGDPGSGNISVAPLGDGTFPPSLNKLYISTLDFYNNDVFGIMSLLINGRIKMTVASDPSFYWFFQVNNISFLPTYMDIDITCVAPGGSIVEPIDELVVISSIIDGVQGFRGFQGEIGNQGLRGLQGFQGRQGDIGFQGNQGNVGLDGFQGSQGNQGLIGFQGSQGNQGLIGFQGNQGLDGSLNAWGLTGNSGIRSTDFIGTSDANGLSVRTNSIERVAINATGQTKILGQTTLSVTAQNSDALIISATATATGGAMSALATNGLEIQGYGTGANDIYLQRQRGSIWVGGLGTETTAIVGINPGGTPKGIFIPRMTTAQRTAINLPANGLLVYDTTTLSIQIYNGTIWRSLLAPNTAGTVIIPSDAANSGLNQIQLTMPNGNNFGIYASNFNTVMANNTNNSRISILGGINSTSGATLWLYGNNYPLSNSSFILDGSKVAFNAQAGDGTIIAAGAGLSSNTNMNGGNLILSGGDKAAGGGTAGAVIMAPNFGNVVIGTSSTARTERLQVYGTAFFGTTSSNARFEADGTLVFTGNGTYFKDLLVTATSLQQTGSGVSLNNTNNSVDFTTTANLSDYLYYSFQMPHEWKEGSTIVPHIHFEQTTSGMPNLMFQYRWQSLGGAKTTAWTNLISNTPVFTYTTGTLNQIAESPGLTIAGGKISDIFQIRVLRDNTNTSGIFTGSDPIGAVVSVTSIDCHIECDTLGSRTATAK